MARLRGLRHLRDECLSGYALPMPADTREKREVCDRITIGCGCMKRWETMPYTTSLDIGQQRGKPSRASLGHRRWRAGCVVLRRRLRNQQTFSVRARRP